MKRVAAGVLAMAAALLVAPTAPAGSPQIDVFISGGDLNIHAQDGTPMGVQVQYLAGPEEWQIVGNFVTEGSGCPDDEFTGTVTCPEGGEDLDVEFSDSGGSITMATADSFLDFDTDIQLGDASDVVNASDGTDIVHHDGSPGSTISGDDIDTLAGDDTITTGDGPDIIDGGDGGDTIVTNDGFNFVNGGDAAGDDSGDGDDDITGGPDQDTIDGGMGNDTIDAGDGNDVIDGSLGDDDIDAGPGADGTGGGTNHLRGGEGNDTIDGGDGTDLIQGGDDSDTLNGDNQNDTLDGGPGTDTLNGGANDDVLLNSDGPDTFNGNANGTTGDEVDYGPTSAAPMTIDIDNVADDGRNCPGGSCENDNVTTTVENVTGDTSADRITGSSAANVLDGAGGDDTLAGGAGTGGDGADRFIGGTGSGDLVTYESRTGAITADIDGAADDGSAGEGDEVETDVEDLTGGSGSDNLTGSTSINELRGGPGTGNDTLTGGAESDLLFGGTGTNTAADGADVFNGGTNTAVGDTVSYAGRTGGITADLDGVADDGSAGENDDVNADVENLTGGSGPDDLTGNAQDNAIDGGGSSDDLAGGTGAADDGSDTFTGGTGSDDEVSYASRTADLDVDIDGVADDGAGGCPAGAGCEDDNVETTVENLVGGSGDDDLTGNNASNELAGNAGDDDLAGGTGTGPDGADTLNGGTHGTPGGQNGAFGDLADYANRTDDLDIDLGGGNDGAGGCPAGPGCEDDDVQVTMDRITAGSGDDVLIGNAQGNILIADEGDDLLRGGAGTGPDGADSFSGGNLGETNGDTVSYANRTDAIVAGPQIGSSGGGGCPLGPGCEDDSINSSVEHITGGSGNDALSGNGADNRLSGGAGDDVLAGSQQTGPDGADTFIGGAQGPAGDTVTYAPTFATRADDVTADIGGGADDVDGDNISSDIDNLTGGDGDDDLFGDSDPNRLDGGAGDDVLAGGQGSGPDGADVFIGGAHGTPGGQHTALRDLVTYSSRTDDITANLATGVGGAAGENDVIDASVERATGGAGDDTLTGDAEANRLEGGNGDDLLAGGVSAGPDGRDIFVGGANTAAGDTVSYAARTDVIAAATASGPTNGAGGCPSALTCEDDDIQSTVENLTGGSNDDTLTGDADPNTLAGGDGEDTMSALGGSDRVEARDGFADTIDCGTESDTAVLDEGTLDTQVLCETLDQPPLQPPQTTITSGPDNPTTRRRATFRFEADEQATFTCRLDSRQSRPCTSPTRFQNLAVGRHKVRVVATDLVGQADPTPAVYRWRIRP